MSSVGVEFEYEGHQVPRVHRAQGKDEYGGSGFVLGDRLKTLPTPHPSRSTMRFQRNNRVDEDERRVTRSHSAWNRHDKRSI